MDKGESDIKHNKYYTSYKPNNIFWGIGIENETYLELPNKEKVDGSFFLKNHKRERYSVDYYSGYLNNYFSKAISTLFKEGELYNLPILMNAHAFLKCDINGEHMTTYTKNPQANPKYSGKSIFDTIQEEDPYFKDEYMKSFCFDGDTVEFMTQNFYNTTINKVIDELIYQKRRFLKHLNHFKFPIFNNSELIYPKVNHGFAKFTTNPKNLAIFNNGTYHFNFTLPTELDENSQIKNRSEFTIKHASAIRCIQFFEPFFVALYGSPDPLTQSEEYKYRFPNGSQRIAASRYISVGTYDTSKMFKGKLLQEDRDIVLKTLPTFFWYNLLYRQINYSKNDKIGFDINYNKFLNHGIELRFFDWFDETLLYEVLEAIVYILDYSQDHKTIYSPANSRIWNKIMYRAILEGKNMLLTIEDVVYIRNTLKLEIKCKTLNVKDIFYTIIDELRNIYKFDGPCSKYMLEAPSVMCCTPSFFKISSPKHKVQLK